MKPILLSVIILGITFRIKAQDETVIKNVKLTGNIQITTPGGSWLTGKTGTGGITSNTQQSYVSYHPLIRQKTAGGHTITLSGLGDYFGFLGYNKDRTENGYDHSMMMNLNTGNIGIGKNPDNDTKLDVNGKLRITNLEVYKFSGTSQLKLHTHQYSGVAKIEITGGSAYNYSGWSIYHSYTNTNKDLYFRHGDSGDPNVVFADNGNVAIYGKLETKEIRISLTPTADFVFENDYNLPTIESIEDYIKEKKHLPEIASAEEMEKKGINIGTFQIQLLQKIEELTLYTISQEKKIKELESLNKKLLELQSRLEKLESKK